MVVTWADRPGLAEWLAHHAAVAAALDLEVLAVNCGGDSEKFLSQCAAAAGDRRIRALECASPVFNKSLATNLAVGACRSDTVLLVDVDVLLDAVLIRGLLSLVDERGFATVRWLDDSPPEGPHGVDRSRPEAVPALREVANVVELVDQNGRTVRIETSRVDLLRRARSAPGLMALRRQAYEDVGGMNSELVGWGWEDNDLAVRLQYVLNLRLRTTGRAAPSAHDVARGALAAKAGSNFDNYVRCLHNYREGRWSGTSSRDRQSVAITEMDFDSSPVSAKLRD